MRLELKPENVDVEVTQRSMSKSTLMLSIETDNGDIDMYMSVEQIQKFIDDTQKSLDKYKNRFNSK
jgi:hypothetical protein